MTVAVQGSNLYNKIIILLTKNWGMDVYIGWETGVEYSYDYEGRIELSGAQPLPPEGSIRVLAQLTIQSVDDSTLLLKVCIIDKNVSYIFCIAFQ